MPSLVFFSTNGVENPTKAALPFLQANASKETGHDAKIVLYGESVLLMKSAVADAVQPVGFPAVKDLLAKTIAHKVPIFV